MTFLEKFQKDHPDINLDSTLEYFCPSFYGYEAEFKCKVATEGRNKYICTRCWEREMPGMGNEVVVTEEDLKAAYNQGMKEAWELAKQILYGIDKQVVEIFDVKVEPVFLDLTHKREIINNHTPQEARAMIDKWKESQKIKVGDIVEHSTYGKMIITKIESEKYIVVLLPDGSATQLLRKKCKKTDKHVDITPILKFIDE